jgi:hypothetical protein
MDDRGNRDLADATTRQQSTVSTFKINVSPMKTDSNPRLMMSLAMARKQNFNVRRNVRASGSGIAGTVRLVVTLIAVGIFCCASSGCSTLLMKPKGKYDKLDTTGLKMAGYTIGEYGANKPLPVNDSGPAVILEVNNGKRHLEKIPMIEGQSLFIADLVRDAQLHKKLGRIKTTIMRPTGPNSAPVRLDVDYDDSGKNVMEGQNYSLRPGDHVVVSLNDSNFLTNLASDFPILPFAKRR